MKRWIGNFMLLMIAIGIGIGLFLMKQRVVEYEKELNAVTKNILTDMHEIHTLKADWAVLTEPSRLRQLLAQSSIQQIDIKQVVLPDEMELTPAPVPPAKPFAPEPMQETESEGENVF